MKRLNSDQRKKDQKAAKTEIGSITRAKVKGRNLGEWLPAVGADDIGELPSFPVLASGLTAMAGGTAGLVAGLTGKMPVLLSS